MYPAAVAVLILATTAAAAVAAPAADRSTSTTVIGSINPELAQGATALQEGHADEGVRLTLDGLKWPANQHDRAAAHANLCAGYALLGRMDEALDHCNISIALDQTNWRAFNNRAAVYVAKGLYEQALHDVHTGLALAPDSAMLKQSLRIANENKRITARRSRAGSKA